MTAARDNLAGTAFAMAFPEWPPSSPPVRHGVAAPLGAIRLAISGKSTHREIKVRMDGLPQRRWMNLARFWWLRNKGAVPPGMRVGHLDGDSMNDDPSNYALFTPGDVIASHHIDNPRWSDRQHQRAGRATAEANRERARIERMRRWFSGRWYAVDLGARRIINEPHRERWMVYAKQGIPVDRRVNGRGYQSSVLGWPGLPKASAAALYVLAAGDRSALELWRGIRELMCRHGWSVPEYRVSLGQFLTPLHARSWIASRTGIGRHRVYAVTSEAIAARGPHTHMVARRGDQLDADEYRLFERVDPAAVESGVAA